MPTACHLSSSYLTSYTVWAELPKAQGRLNASQQGHHIQVLDSAPEEPINCISKVVADVRHNHWGRVGSSL